MKPFLLLGAVFIATGMAQGAKALPPLETNDRVMSELVAGEVGYQIQKHCPSIHPRLLRVSRRLNDLRSYAESLGYSSSDVKALQKNPDARARRDALTATYLAQNGVSAGDAESYCRLGLEEIEKNTLTGWLLRAN